MPNNPHTYLENENTQHIDPRHQRRQACIQELFAAMFTAQPSPSEFSQYVLDAQDKIDPLIEKAASAWPLAQINKIDLAILRLAIFELLDKKEPIKVVIDEAVELAKEFGSESSPSFVNGVLGKIVEDLETKQKEKEEKHE